MKAEWKFIYGSEIVTVTPRPGENLTSFIEEKLYILWEFSPIHRDWRKILNKTRVITISYCDQLAIAQVNKKQHIVMVIDIK